MEYTVIDIEVLNDVVNIELKDNSFNVLKYKVHIVAYTNYYFSINQKIDDDFLNSLIKDSNFYFVKDTVIKKIKTKDYSSKEIRDFLVGKLSEEEIEKLIINLEKNNYLNDYNYVKSIFSDAQNKLKGKLYIESKLKDKGIKENIIDSFYEHFNEKLYAEKLVNSEYNKLKNKYPKNVLINKIKYKLSYNGFSMDIIYDVTSSLEFIKNETNEEILVKDFNKVYNKYKNKLKNKELERKVIESLIAKGYNYKSVKDIVERMIEND